ncbi:hypothetical protein SLS64_011861 [Diaporthe eres]
MAWPPQKQCDYHEKHIFAVTVGLDHSLKIEFPHSAWAEAFTNHVNRSEWHRRIQTDACVRRPNWRVVHLRLPRSVRGVEVKKDRDAGPGALGVGLYFEFDGADSARRWYENTKLWSQTSNDLKLFMPLEWRHGTFDSFLDIETSVKPAQDDVVRPAEGSRVHKVI